MSLKKNQTVTLKIDNITNLGFGVGRHLGEVVFVSDTVPGDEVECLIIKASKSYSVAKPTRFISYSQDRVNDRCKFPACRACSYKHISYEKECEIKRASVISAFNKAGLSDVVIGELIPSPKICEYRNKAQYPISKDAHGEYRIGFYAPKTHRVAEAAACPLAPKIFSDIIESLRAFFKKYDLSVYDEDSGRGLLRHIYLRRGEISGEVLITLVVNGESLPHSAELCEKISSEFPTVVGILLNENTENTNVILGNEFKLLFGRDHIIDTLSGVKLKITAPSFYQVNHASAELLYAKARELAGLMGDELLLDLYCGAGSIGLSMLDSARELIGVEIVDSAVECAKLNAEMNGYKNALFYTGDATESSRILENAEKCRGEKILPDIVILDPPRKGSDKALLTHIASLSPKRIVYISCNPETLARDAVTLCEGGYCISEVTPVDLFPMTGHVECVCKFERAGVTHEMKLHAEPFEMIKCGKKTIELRLYDEKRRKIKVGDRITFRRSKTGEELTAEVLRLHIFESFTELYKRLPLLKCGYTEDDIATASPSDMDAYYSHEEQAKYGVIGIELSIKED